MADTSDLTDRIDRLREEYGEFPVETAETELPPATYERAIDLHERGIPGAARVWVERDGATLLVREEDGRDSWGVAGGLIEPDERADRAGEREVREETGVECEIFDVGYVHRGTRRHRDGDGIAFEDLGVAFVAEYVGGEARPEPGEIEAVRWFETLPDDVHSPADRIAEERLGD